MTIKVLKQIELTDAIYFAGFFDGEGCIGIYERAAHHAGPDAKNPYFAIGISVSNTNFEVLRHIKRTCGGIIGKKERDRLTQAGNLKSPLWRWSAQSRESIHIVKFALPYLIVKREQALFAIEFHNSVMEYSRCIGHWGHVKLTPEEVQRRRDCVTRMMSLKRSPK